MPGDPFETFARVIGSLCQVGGLWWVVWELNALQRKYSAARRGPLDNLIRALALRQKRKPVTHDIEAKLTGSGDASGTPTIIRGPPPINEQDLKGRIADMERQFKECQQRLESRLTGISESLAELEERINFEREARTQATSELQRSLLSDIKDLAIGTITIKYWGVGTVGAGLVIQTLPGIVATPARWLWQLLGF